MKFLGNVLSTVIGIFVFILLIFFGLIFISAISGGGSDVVSVEKNSVIELDLSEITNDYAGKFTFKDAPFLDDTDTHDGLTDVVFAIKNAETDSNIKGISILNNTSSLGMAQSKAVRDALEGFKKSGKFVYAYANSFTQKEYYLNSVANKIYLNPIGDMDFKGLSSEIMFFKDFQDQSGLKMEVIRHGKYKSAVEPFLENKMSDANREQVTALLNSVWNSVVADISVSRNIPVEKINTIANGLLARTPEMAKAEKLVDIVDYEDVYHDAIRKMLKVDNDEEYNSIKIIDYAQNIGSKSSMNFSDNSIAIIYAQGEIMSGEGDVDVIGEGSMRRSLIEARKDENIKAIVLRVDSPGGNALTSDLIWREIELTKKVKPVIVSMGNYAASGGYYIACNANRIFAEENTITGSIGVFGILPNFTVAANKFGFHTELVKTHENASDYSPFVPLNDNFKMVTQEMVENIYTTFVSRVAKGRNMTEAQVDSIAQGRVWSGSEAKKIGLVDEIGGMDKALKYAASLAKIKEYTTINYPEYEKDFKDILNKMGLPFAKTKDELIKDEIGLENYKAYQELKRFSLRKGVQASMLYQIEIK